MSDIHRLALTIAGPNHREQLVLYSVDRDDLEPKTDGDFESYGNVEDGDVIEVRSDHVVIRSYSIVDTDKMSPDQRAQVMKIRERRGADVRP